MKPLQQYLRHGTAACIAMLVERGELGKKSGKGFYDWEATGA